MNPEPINGFKVERYTYSLMTRGGKYQWRYDSAIPEELQGDPAASPVFDSMEEAVSMDDMDHFRFTQDIALDYYQHGPWTKISP